MYGVSWSLFSSAADFNDWIIAEINDKRAIAETCKLLFNCIKEMSYSYSMRNSISIVHDNKIQRNRIQSSCDK